jgi:hypothetical protein
MFPFRVPGRVIGDAARLLSGGRVNAIARVNLPELGNFWSVYGHIGAFYRAMQAEEAVWTIPRVGRIIDFWMPELAPLQRRNSCFRSNGAAAQPRCEAAKDDTDRLFPLFEPDTHG